jgi:hypothetical protein
VDRIHLLLSDVELPGIEAKQPARNGKLRAARRQSDLKSRKVAATLVWLAGSLGTRCLPAAEYPQAVIASGGIRAKLYLPDVESGYYRGTRFDWSGVIASLEYKGHSYFGPWFQKTGPKIRDFVYDGPDIVAGPCSAITGPVEEFSTSGKALGYDEAVPGGAFIKIGVGVLRKPDASAYDHYRLYDIVDRGKWTVRSGPDWIEFVQELTDASGYGYLYRKAVRLSGEKSEMVLEHSLKNTGRRVIETSVYDHNFLVLDNQAPGPDFVITFPFEIRTNQLPDRKLAEVRGNQIVYVKRLEAEDHVQTSVQGFSSSPQDYDIRIENRKIGAGMRITGDRPLARAMLWSIRSVLSLEPYIAMTIEPGREFTWNLTYDFYALPAGNKR